ncbi:Hypothetical_protein [Hexamita inflata]|uniref:Hypothetical_protein n=1 Tax=Hexamita inflata TaxID=28002 RepID=A0AA86RL98_9EUKA|nr:Hypothetical protein HINF_LOCUS66417 [Hexamita inflata]
MDLLKCRSSFDEVEKLSGGSLILRIAIKIIKQTLSLGIIWNIIKICICCVKYKNQVDRSVFPRDCKFSAFPSIQTFKSKTKHIQYRQNAQENVNSGQRVQTTYEGD